MAKWSIRELWRKRSEKKELSPEVRSMLLSLDGVYEPRGSDKSPAPAQDERAAQASKR